MKKQEEVRNYCVEGVLGFTKSEALALWKTKYDTYEDFHKAVITHPALNDMGEEVKEWWDKILPVCAADAFYVGNLEQRRVWFTCIGVKRLFKSLQPKLLDRQVITKKRTRWKEDNTPYEHKFKDTYELYEIDGEKLFKDVHTSVGRERAVVSMMGTPESLYAVRCWCTTTDREYWIYVPKEAGYSSRWALSSEKPDAVKAIAWTVRIDIQNPKRIFRQGDIIIAEASGVKPQLVTPYHLTKDQYLKLMYSET